MKTSQMILTAVLGLSAQAMAMSPVLPHATVACEPGQKQVTKLVVPENTYLVVAARSNPSAGFYWVSKPVAQAQYVSDCGDKPVPGCGGTSYFSISSEKIEETKGILGYSTFVFTTTGTVKSSCTVKIKYTKN